VAGQGKPGPPRRVRPWLLDACTSWPPAQGRPLLATHAWLYAAASDAELAAAAARLAAAAARLAAVEDLIAGK
jgi:hypothetical protein